MYLYKRESEEESRPGKRQHPSGRVENVAGIDRLTFRDGSLLLVTASHPEPRCEVRAIENIKSY